MTDALPVLRALPIAALDLTVGVLLYHHLAPTIGLVFAAIGVLLLCAVAYRAVRVVIPGRPHLR